MGVQFMGLLWGDTRRSRPSARCPFQAAEIAQTATTGDAIFEQI